MDDLLGTGWTLISKADPESALSERCRRLLATIDTRSVHVTRASIFTDTAAVDLDATYARWFAALDADVALVRPDNYVFGAAKADRLGGLISELEQQLHLAGLAASASGVRHADSAQLVRAGRPAVCPG